MGDQLVDFFRSRKEHAAAGPQIDWQAKKDSWIRSVEGLYKLIEEMLRDSIAAKDVLVSRTDIEVTEDFVGTYSIPALELSVGNERVEFRPKGITVIGAEGRLDIRGQRDSVTLLKDAANADGGWTIVLQRVPRVITVELDRESLRDVLERVMLPLP
jgi:hypothetical protein